MSESHEGLKLRTRVLRRTKFKKRMESYSAYDPNPYQEPESVYAEVHDHQMTWSRSNHWPDGQWAGWLGGPFDTIRMESHFRHPHEREWRIFTPGYYNQTRIFNLIPAWPDTPNAFLPNAKWEDLATFVSSLGDETLKERGVIAINLTAPTNPKADLSTALMELYREGVPSLVGAQTLARRSHAAKSAGSEYLNVQFGWAPLVSDVKKACKAIIDQDQILSQLHRDSGKQVRREFEFPRDATATITTLSLNAYPKPWYTTSQWNNYGQNPTQEDRLVRKVWFSGAYTYYIDPAVYEDRLRSIVQQAHFLYNVRLTPDLLWNIAPWTWLVDWFVGVGPVLENVNLFTNDQLALRYGYVMETTVKSRTFRWPGLSWASGNPQPPVKGTWKGTRKRRVVADPFFVGLVNESLTLRQLAILSALGISRT